MSGGCRHRTRQLGATPASQSTTECPQRPNAARQLSWRLSSPVLLCPPPSSSALLPLLALPPPLSPLLSSASRSLRCLTRRVRSALTWVDSGTRGAVLTAALEPTLMQSGSPRTRSTHHAVLLQRSYSASFLPPWSSPHADLLPKWSPQVRSVGGSVGRDAGHGGWELRRAERRPWDLPPHAGWATLHPPMPRHQPLSLARLWDLQSAVPW